MKLPSNPHKQSKHPPTGHENLWLPILKYSPTVAQKVQFPQTVRRTLQVNNIDITIQSMSVIEITPSKELSFTVPHDLTSKFKVTNLGLRSLHMYIINLHPNYISLSTTHTTIPAFECVEVLCLLHWSQSLNCLFRSKLRVYAWELEDEDTPENGLTKMFNYPSETNPLHFEEVAITTSVGGTDLQDVSRELPLGYLISRVRLPNYQSVAVTEKMMNEVINQCLKVGEAKAIYTYGKEYVAEFTQPKQIISSFCEVRNNQGELAVFGIACLPHFGRVISSPDFLTLPEIDEVSSNSKSTPKKQSQGRTIPDKPQKITDDNSPIPKTPKQNQINHHPSESSQPEQPNPNTTPTPPKYQQPHQKDTQSSIKNLRTQTVKTTKQSFIEQRNKKMTIKRSRSQQIITQNEEEDKTGTVDINNPDKWCEEPINDIRIHKPIEQKSLDVAKSILNMALSVDEKEVYLLLQDCLVVCQTENPSTKRFIKFSAIDPGNPTPMLVFTKQKTVIFANESYLFWASLSGDAGVQSKWVQRKHIFAIEVVEELNLLMVGGKNFSKLSYLGKSTSRSNIKVYSCGKLSKRDHLFTYDIPQCNGENVVEMKHITTKPNNTKLLLVITNHSVLYFLRIKAFNNIENYCRIHSCEIGMQEIVGMNYLPSCCTLICMERLGTENYHCLKFIKASCSYEKVEIFTESVKLPVGQYFQFRMGGREGSEWVSAIDVHNVVHWMYLEGKKCEKIEYSKPIKDYFVLKNGGIYREETQMICRIHKS